LVLAHLDGAQWPRGQCAWRAIAEVKQRSQKWVIGWVTKNLLSRAPPCFGRHVKLLVGAFAVVRHQSARVVGYGQFSLSGILKEGLCPSSGILLCLPKHGQVRDSKFLATHPMTNLCNVALLSR
jgi:hypothetical protein